jgi:hypothetical protein
MKFETCPKCGNTDLGDRWVTGRKLMQYCGDDDCGWNAIPRTPERKHITNMVDIRVDGFYGWAYHTYDKYGHVACYSRTYSSEAKALKELEDDLKRSSKDEDGGPYTGVLFFTPASVKVKGKMFKFKNNEFYKL